MFCIQYAFICYILDAKTIPIIYTELVVYLTDICVQHDYAARARRSVTRRKEDYYLLVIVLILLFVVSTVQQQQHAAALYDIV